MIDTIMKMVLTTTLIRGNSMRCDYCNCQLTPGNNGGYAPNGLPLYVCKACYQKLKDEKVVEDGEQEEQDER